MSQEEKVSADQKQRGLAASTGSERSAVDETTNGAAIVQPLVEALARFVESLEHRLGAGKRLPPGHVAALAQTVAVLARIVMPLALVAGVVAAYIVVPRLAMHAPPPRESAPPPPPVSAAVLMGYVIDAETRVPLADVRLMIEDWDTRDGGSPMAVTDSAGRFRFENLRPSDDPLRQVRLIATKTGYDTSTTDPPLGATDHPIKLKPLTSRETRP
jgi:hypothetical protein